VNRLASQMRRVVNNIVACISRSLIDFGRLMEVLDKHKVSLVSVTQAFSITRSIVRPTLNIRLLFG